MVHGKYDDECQRQQYLQNVVSECIQTLKGGVKFTQGNVNVKLILNLEPLRQ